MDKNSLSHTKWRCKYHVVFAPKYRRQAIYGKLKKDIGQILRELCQRKGINIIEAELCVDHVHMLIEVPPKYSILEIMGYLKGKSSLIIFDRHANLKYKYGNRHFWCRGYYVEYSRTKWKDDKRIYTKPIKRRLLFRPNQLKKLLWPVYGWVSTKEQINNCLSSSWDSVACGEYSEPQ